MRTMKFLSLITVLIVLVTLFTLVLSQLNKDETKHEYGIAFPLEESGEPRLPPPPSPFRAKQSTVTSDASATTTTETVATSDSSSNDQSDLSGDKPETSTTSTNENSNNEPSSNPKLIFIERLMDLNFKNPNNPLGPFQSIMELGGSNTDKDKDSDDSKDSPPSDLAWGNTLDTIRSRWESRLRKFTYPFQNTYSVVLRASNVIDNAPSSSEPETASTTEEKSAPQPSKPAEEQPEVAPTPAVKYFYHSSTSGGPLGGASMMGGGPMVQSQNNAQANQLFRMAALAMMSKLFSALRSQAMAPSKLDMGHHKLELGTNHLVDSLDTDDDDDDDIGNNEIGDRNTETITVPIVIGQRPSRQPTPTATAVLTLSESQPDDDDRMPPVRTIMYGRPSPLPFMAPPRAPQQNPLVALLQAAAVRARRMEQLEQQRQQEREQPQRLILFISHRGEPEGREAPPPPPPPPQQPEPTMYHPSPSGASVAYYAPLSPPSSPVLYQYSHAPSPPPQPRQHVIEVPVPVYVPVRVRAQPQPQPIMPKAPLPRMVSPESPRPMTVMYYPHPVESEMRGPMEQPSVVEESSSPSEPNAVVRILFRPKISPEPSMMMTAPPPRFAYHRRADAEEMESASVEPTMVAAGHEGAVVYADAGRLQQWRDYSNSHGPIQHQPVTHLLVAAAPSNSPSRPEPETSASQPVATATVEVTAPPAGDDDHLEGGDQSAQPVSPFFYADMEQTPLHHPPMPPQPPMALEAPHPMPPVIPPHHLLHAMSGQSSHPHGGVAGHTAFLILADPNESGINSNDQ